MRKLLLLLLCITFNECAISQCSELEILNLRKTALIIGEKNYSHANPLKNTVNDAQDIATALRSIGFDVNVYTDADLKTINSAVDQWCSKLSLYNVALFYFSGHGAEYNSENYLFPIDANPKQPNEMALQCLSANSLLSKMDNSNIRFNIMILDACRSNPFAKSWVRDFASGGLAVMTGKGTFIGYAASPGKTASDGTGRNGTYTEAILKYLTIPSLTIDQIFTKVNSYVREISKEAQIPFKNSSLSSDYCFSVKRSKQSYNVSKHIYIQPPTEALITNDQSFLINVTDSGILIKDAFTLNNLQSIRTCDFRPLQITSKTGENLIVLDSQSRRVLTIDTKLKVITDTILLEYTPTTVVLSNIGDKAFVGFNDYKYGGIYIIDLSTNKILKTVKLSSVPQSICVNANDKKLYVLSSNLLLQLDANSGSIIRSMSIEESCKSLGVSPDNKLVLIGCQKNNVGKTLVVDAGDFSVKKTIEFPTDLFAFTLDSAKVFAVSLNELYVIDLQNFSITNRIPFKSVIKGVAISTDGVANIWLPSENRFYVYKIDQLTIRNELDPEIKLKEFKHDAKNDYVEAMNEHSKVMGIFSTLQSVYEQAVNEIKNDLGPAYSVTTRGGTRFMNVGDSIGMYASRSFGERFALYAFNHSKNISTHYVCKLTSEDLVLKIYDQSNKKNPPEIFKAALNNIDWEEVKKFVRKYFLFRLDRLRE